MIESLLRSQLLQHARYRGPYASIHVLANRFGEIWCDALVFTNNWRLREFPERFVEGHGFAGLVCGVVDLALPSDDDMSIPVLRLKMYANLDQNRCVPAVVLEFYRLEDDYKTMVEDRTFWNDHHEVWMENLKKMMRMYLEGKTRLFTEMCEVLQKTPKAVRTRKMEMPTISVAFLKDASFPYEVYNDDGSFDGFIQEDSILAAWDDIHASSMFGAYYK